MAMRPFPKLFWTLVYSVTVNNVGRQCWLPQHEGPTLSARHLGHVCFYVYYRPTCVGANYRPYDCVCARALARVCVCAIDQSGIAVISLIIIIVYW